MNWMNMATSTERERLERFLLGQHTLLTEVHQWLEEEQKHDDILRAVVLSSRKERPVKIEGLDPDRIFSLGTIRESCIKYRLRFLDGGLFKGEIPLQAVHAIRELERHAQEPLSSFKIMAPAERFKLCDSEVDPLLFVPVATDAYYLVHKWGSDLSPLRVLRGWPTRAPSNLAFTVTAFAALIALIIPGYVLETWQVNRMIFMIWCTMVCYSFTLFGWFAFFGQFSVHCWNSKYFNS